MNNTNEIVLYQPDATVHLEVMIDDDTVWLTQQQMMELFQTSRQNISLHVNNIFKEGELVKKNGCQGILDNHSTRGSSRKNAKAYRETLQS